MMTPASLVVLLLLVPVPALLMLVLPARQLAKQVHCLGNPRHQHPQFLCRAARKLAGTETQTQS